MKEIGGYFELEHYEGQEYYPDLFKFNLGRTAITHFLKEVGCKTLYVPYFLCDSVTDACLREGIRLHRYKINRDFTPCIPDLPHAPLPKETWIFVANHYGQLTNADMKELKSQFDQVLFDMTHAFFHRPLPHMDAVYSVRKYFGVSDGAYLATDRAITMPSQVDKSSTRMTHILGRVEDSAGDHYQEMLDNAHSYVGAKALQMSPLTKELLGGINYTAAGHKRFANYMTLHSVLGKYNKLVKHGILQTPMGGPFVYPMQVSDGVSMRKALAKKKIFVPTYWSNVITSMPKESLEYQYAANILALPCDQRYDEKDMLRMIYFVLCLLKEQQK